jgi:hypothetical protein
VQPGAVQPGAVQPGNGTRDDGAQNDRFLMVGSDNAAGATPPMEPLGTSPQCGSDVRPCGGLLVGIWTVKDTCTREPLDREPVQSWVQAALGLDPEACAGALQGLTSRWSGLLRFADGYAIDERLRSDAIEVGLSQDCLAATLGTSIGEGELAQACTSISTGATQCSSVDGTCQCSVQRDEQASVSGLYGVIETSVVIGAAEIVEIPYCIQGDLLHWRDAETGQHLLLRRE